MFCVDVGRWTIGLLVFVMTLNKIRSQKCATKPHRGNNHKCNNETMQQCQQKSKRKKIVNFDCSVHFLFVLFCKRKKKKKINSMCLPQYTCVLNQLFIVHAVYKVSMFVCCYHYYYMCGIVKRQALFALLKKKKKKICSDLFFFYFTKLCCLKYGKWTNSYSG